MKFVFKNIEAAQYLASRHWAEVESKEEGYEVVLDEIEKPTEPSDTIKQELEAYTEALYEILENLRGAMYKEVCCLGYTVLEHQQKPLPTEIAEYEGSSDNIKREIESYIRKIDDISNGTKQSIYGADIRSIEQLKTVIKIWGLQEEYEMERARINSY
jgi:hypothetical protein